ncbi:hypothetical protein P3339_08035 [Microbulbifer sp. MLAF003]|uniref:hypothetical protein n=1 Tax=Microbulbifer sp. MLAF003 TaxID=3032582 RepID=UPI0024ADB15F|nr:hypothetical protein [Microbulbifer sp. MLAF003]WHI52697.1 hypothetical protein P3339_08035 [Microbulbifer sp. MLAF003]
MNFHSARQAWHDAFDTTTQQSDYAAMLGGQTVRSRGPKHYIDEIRNENGKVTARLAGQTVYATETRVGKGSSGRIMDACEKGLVQHAIAKLRETDELAYCWGMAAYAPPGNRYKERAYLLNYMMKRFYSWGEPHDPLKVGQLAFYCIHSVALRDVSGKRIDLCQARKLLSCDKEEWDRKWRKIWVRLVRLLDPLPGIALPFVCRFMEACLKKS